MPEIIRATINDVALIADIVSRSNRDVAEQFGLTRQNNPKHPSFYTPEWALADFTRGEEYFLYRSEGIEQGCVAFEQPDPDTVYLNRLSVLPVHRHRGVGEKLVRYVIEYARSKDTGIVSIGIIAHHQVLKRWYAKLGFTQVGTTTFEHLPFDVTYMHYRLRSDAQA